MKNLKLFLLVLLLIPLAAFVLHAAASPANACTPDDSGVSCADSHLRSLSADTSTPTPTIVPADTDTPTPVIVPVATATPRGDNPTTARDITDTWSSIDPRAIIWFKTDYSAGYREIELWVDTPAQNALGLSIFSPDQADSWWYSKPVGRGSYNPGMPSHALTWKAAYAEGGIWYALLQNYTDLPVPYRLTGNITSTATKSCHGYWEYLPNGTYIYWVDCNPAHNPQ